MSELKVVETTDQELQRLREENAKLRAKVGKTARDGIKVSIKGAVSVYGFQRFPITLYAAQWQKLAEKMPMILQFIDSMPEGLVQEKPANEHEPITEQEAA